MSLNADNPIVTVEIGGDGQIVGSEKIDGKDGLDRNQLPALPAGFDMSTVEQIEVQVSYRITDSNWPGGAMRCLVAKICRDRFGRVIQCT